MVNAGMKSPSYIRQILPYGFESFNLMFWQTTKGIDWEKLADDVGQVLEGSNAVVSSLGMYGNPLETEELDIETLNGWEACIKNAHLFGCDIVGGFTGRLRGETIDGSLERFKEIWKPLAEKAEDNNIRIAFENCSMGGDWQSGDWNIAHNPAAWEMMFNALPNENIGLEWEPCHQMITLIDPLPQIKEYGDRIFHVHGKDATIKWDIIKKYGIGTTINRETAEKYHTPIVPPFAEHRTPGFGDSNWTDIISELRLKGFNGSIDIEGWHDPVYKDDLEMTGQVHGLNYLKNCRGGSYINNPKI